MVIMMRHVLDIVNVQHVCPQNQQMSSLQSFCFYSLFSLSRVPADLVAACVQKVALDALDGQNQETKRVSVL